LKTQVILDGQGSYRTEQKKYLVSDEHKTGTGKQVTFPLLILLKKLAFRLIEPIIQTTSTSAF